MIVNDLMTRTVVTCSPDTTIDKAARLMIEHNCGAIPVVERSGGRGGGEGKGGIIGIITDRDIAVRAVAEDLDPRTTPVSAVMTSGCRCVTPDSTVDETVRVMEEHQVRRVPVVDGSSGECCGIVAQADIALKTDEHCTAEVVREISKHD